jgi:hypothetical protein
MAADAGGEVLGGAGSDLTSPAALRGGDQHAEDQVMSAP